MKRIQILLSALLAGLFLLLLPAGSSAQKIEIEKRISADEMPVEAMTWLEMRFPDRDRSRYYEEMSDAGRTVEAKFRHQAGRYSVEFFTDGRWKETEREVPFEDLPPAVREAINRQLEDFFRRHRVIRAQEQLTEGTVTGYELEIKGKSADHLGYFEGQFDAAGEQRRIRTVEKRPNEFLFF